MSDEERDELQTKLDQEIAERVRLQAAYEEREKLMMGALQAALAGYTWLRLCSEQHRDLLTRASAARLCERMQGYLAPAGADPEGLLHYLKPKDMVLEEQASDGAAPTIAEGAAVYAYGLLVGLQLAVQSPAIRGRIDEGLKELDSMFLAAGIGVATVKVNQPQGNA